jgi:hypothetical protein
MCEWIAWCVFTNAPLLGTIVRPLGAFILQRFAQPSRLICHIWRNVKESGPAPANVSLIRVRAECPIRRVAIIQCRIVALRNEGDAHTARAIHRVRTFVTEIRRANTFKFVILLVVDAAWQRERDYG